MRRWIPWATGAILILALMWAFVYLQTTHPFGSLETKLTQDELPGIGIELVGVKFIGRQNGNKAWTLNTDLVDVSRDRRYVTFRGATDGAILKGENKVVSVSARKIVYNTITRNLTIPGAARLKVNDGPCLTAKNIQWDAHNSRLVCSGGIQARFDGSTMEGENMVADLSKKEITMRKVRGVIRLPD